MTFTGIPSWAVLVLVGAAAGLLAVLHLLRVRPRPLRVVTTLFWRQAAEAAKARTLLERFRHPLTYALLLLICSLVVLALGRPERRAGTESQVSKVFILHAGASMSARDARTGGSRLGAASQALLAEARNLALSDRLAVVVADPWPRILQGFEDPRPVLARRLSQVKPAQQPAAGPPAEALAGSLLHGRPHPEIVVFTDRAPDETTGLPANEAPPVRRVRVGSAASNTAILSAMFVPDQQNPLKGAFRIRAGHWGPDAKAVRVRVHRAGGAPLLDATRPITPGTTADFTADGLQADGDRVKVELTGDDAVEADNRAVFRLPLRQAIRVATDDAVPNPIGVLLSTAPEMDTSAPLGKEDVRILVGRGSKGTTVPAVVIIEEGTRIESGLPVRTTGDSNLIRGLELEDAVCGEGPALENLPLGSETLLTVGRATVAAWVRGKGQDHPRLLLSRAIVSQDATLPHRPAFAMMLIRAVRLLAGWEPDPIVLTPERALTDPLWADSSTPDRSVQVAPGSRVASDLTVSGEASGRVTASHRRYLPEPFEVLLGLALALAGLEAVLHARGKIS
jgi:hypothetical protein